MSLTSLQSLTDMLSAALHQPDQRQQLIRDFQQIIWKSDVPTSWEFEVLRDLAHDLDFYEPDVARRAEDASFYDDERVQEEISAALRKLGR